MKVLVILPESKQLRRFRLRKVRPSKENNAESTPLQRTTPINTLRSESLSNRLSSRIKRFFR